LVWIFAVHLGEESESIGVCSRTISDMSHDGLSPLVESFEEQAYYGLLAVKAATLQRRYRIIAETNRAAQFTLNVDAAVFSATSSSEC
jgi:hypothetical protein